MNYEPRTNNLVSKHICPPFTNHRLKPDTPDDWIILKIHYSIIRNTRNAIVRLIAIQHSKRVSWVATSHFNNGHHFMNGLLDILLGVFAILGGVTKISTSTAFCVQQDWTHNISGTVLNIVGVKPILGSIEADFAEH